MTSLRSEHLNVTDAMTWACREDIAPHPWLVLGKGPSFQLRENFDLRPYLTLGLNDVVREMAVTVAHAVDLEVIERNAEAIDANARFLLMPIRPRRYSLDAREDLFSLAKGIPLLKHLLRHGRLICYQLLPATLTSVQWLWARHSEEAQESVIAPTVWCRSFSSVAAIAVLAACGVRVIRTLGIDGGSSYSDNFQDLDRETLLTNGRPDFSAQFQEIADLIRKFRLDLAPLDKATPIRIYVGASRREKLSARVLEFSIRRHASRSVVIEPMYTLAERMADEPWSMATSGTNFSFFRFAIPQLTGFQGRAIYLDSDMLVLHDIRELWDASFEGADLLATNALEETNQSACYSVLVLNCETLAWDVKKIVQDLEDGHYTYNALMRECCLVDPTRKRLTIPREWNSLEWYEQGRTRLLHYTHVPTQPWISAQNLLGRLWTEYLLEAIAEGFILVDEVVEEVRLGNVRSSLLAQIKHGIADPWALSRHELMADRNFSPPYLARMQNPHPALVDFLRFSRARLSWRLGQTRWYPAAARWYRRVLSPDLRYRVKGLARALRDRSRRSSAAAR